MKKNNKKEHYISTKTFVQNFPKKVEDLTIRYKLSSPPKVGYRRLNDYIREKLMPEPYSIDRKAKYIDSLGMYRWLFIIWYLFHFRRASSKKILKILNSLREKGEFEAVLLLLDEDEFLDKILVENDINSVLREIGEESYPVWKEIEYVHKIIKYILNRDIESFKGNLELYIESPKLVNEEKIYIKNRFKSYKKIAEEIERVLEEINRLKAKTRI